MEKMPLTYCNPLPIPCLPRGKDDWYPAETEMFSHEDKPDFVTGPDYRSISDPTVFYHDGKWYLYPSYGMAWVSEDFVHWEHHRTEPYCPLYSPHVVPWKGRYLLVAWNCPLYVADDPLGPFEKLGEFILPDGRLFRPCDPGLFADEDGKVYLYAHCSDPIDGYAAGACTYIVGWQMDDDDPRRLIGERHVIVKMDTANHVWERNGHHHQDVTFGWIEGPHLLKHNGRYYMIYASPDTRTPGYSLGVYYSDESPLTGFICQKNNPLTVNRAGLVGGAGHGCVEHGPNGSLWAFYTIATPVSHKYERRIGMDPVSVDENGELYCPLGITDTPQYAPGTAEAAAGLQPGLLPLNSWWVPTVSGCAPGRDAIYAVDESPLTWWQPADDDETPWLCSDLESDYFVCAVRIFWRDVGLNYAAGAIPGPFRYRVEGCTDGAWFTLVDRQDSAEDLDIDYRTFAPVHCRKVRLVITGTPRGIRPGVVAFTVFGKHVRAE